MRGISLLVLVASLNSSCASFKTPVHRDPPQSLPPSVSHLPSAKALSRFWTSDAFQILKLCSGMRSLYLRNKWGPLVMCEDIPFEIMGWSVEQRPLLSFRYGPVDSKKITLVQCGIHGDELPSLPMCLRLIEEVLTGKRRPPTGVLLIVQPLLNPDGMLATKPTRQNANGVDVNRNFPTQDWEAQALKSWETRDRKDPRKYPGPRSASEPETRAIVDYLERVRPQKIISIHTPLGFLDLDSRGKPHQVRRAEFLAVNMSKNAGNFRFKTFGFYPGSLGNYAGNERQIPVYTLELPPGSERPTIDEYWVRFRRALWRAIDFDLDTGQFVED